jgi:hypothetical protein
LVLGPPTVIGYENLVFGLALVEMSLRSLTSMKIDHGKQLDNSAL